MNRIKIAVIILIVSVVFSTISLIFIHESCGTLIEKLDKVIKNTNEESIFLAAEDLQGCIDYFEKVKPFLNALVGQGEAIEIRGDLNKAIFFINVRDYESAILHLQECKTDLNKIIVSSTPSISTVLYISFM